jgi:hypothetical protein
MLMSCCGFFGLFFPMVFTPKEFFKNEENYVLDPNHLEKCNIIIYIYKTFSK